MKSNLPPAPESYRRSHKLLGPPLNKLHLSCSYFSELTVTSMDRRLTFGERLSQIIHFCVCGMCRKVVKQMHSLRALVRASVTEDQARQPDPEFLANLRDRLKEVSGETDTPGPNR
jgi:large-conductance mechanosensitive channel